MDLAIIAIPIAYIVFTLARMACKRAYRRGYADGVADAAPIERMTRAERGENARRLVRKRA